ncbi:unnamed protein product [Adineta steineri]|uniref:Uncharacterized protein n=1 Tax=Adineta steineri TaxID=433720 RepID=A0A815KYF1_9BILA|nr:unnamed protein product [Adineta steineri]
MPTFITRPGLWKILLLVGIGLLLIAFILGWIGFGVPDWHAFHRYNYSSQEYFGLWSYCQDQSPLFNTVCNRWSTAQNELFNGSKPSFVTTADGLITTGMIFLSLGLIAAILAAILPLLAYLAAILTLTGFVFLIIGIPIFGAQSTNFSKSRGDAQYNKRYGFWLMIPTIVLSFLAAILFLIAGYLYQQFGFGNVATRSKLRQPVGGQRMLGPANQLYGMPYAARPGIMQNPYQYQRFTGQPGPSLLSQYIARRMPRYYGGPVIVRRAVSVVSQPVGTPAYVTPAYYKSAAVAQPINAPLINLTGRTIVGPPVRTA